MSVPPASPGEPREPAAPAPPASAAPAIGVRAEPLTSDAFRPFGAVIDLPRAAADASGHGWAWWARAASLPPDDRPLAIGYLVLEPAAARFDWAERHARSAEAILPLDGECVVYVALPAPEPAGFRAFRVAAGSGVVLDPGVWHGAPLALDRPLCAIVLLPEGTGAEDTVVARFQDQTIEV
ncbi:MAG: ureidoglycolate lyase [Solirubrobacteraceae bacterium]